jgi:DNA processing protein
MSGLTPVEYRADVEARLALVHLSGMGPARSRWLLAKSSPGEMVERMRSGRRPVDLEAAPPGIRPVHIEKWLGEVATLDPSALYQAQKAEGWTILSPHDDCWPFAEDPEPPLLLFCTGNIELLAPTTAVAIVGTRRCTTVGRTVAHQLGFEMAEAGVRVVSGLALGIDAAAHRGALDGGGPVVGVVGTGLDVIYPLRNRSLWAEVGAKGLLLSEYPAGTKPERWRFPARNRLIAGLTDAVVIVESHHRGGSLLTAEEAADRGKAVYSVPGSVVSPAADGTNELIIDGANPARDAGDVLTGLGLSQPSTPTVSHVGAGDGSQSSDPSLPFDGNRSPLADLVRREVRSGATGLDQLILVSAHTPVQVVHVVKALEDAGEVRLEGSTVSWIGL